MIFFVFLIILAFYIYLYIIWLIFLNQIYFSPSTFTCTLFGWYFLYFWIKFILALLHLLVHYWVGIFCILLWVFATGWNWCNKQFIDSISPILFLCFDTGQKRRVSDSIRRRHSSSGNRKRFRDDFQRKSYLFFCGGKQHVPPLGCHW